LTADRLDGVIRALAMWDSSRTAPIGRNGLAMVELVTAARRHRLVGVLAAAVAAGDVDGDDDDVDTVAREVSDAMAEALLLEDMMLEAVGVLGELGLDIRVLKGSALAHIVHPDPAHRSFGDTDLLVRSSQIDAAVEALTGAGGHRRIPALSGDFDRRFAKSITLDWRRGTELDLHRTLAPGPFGLRIPLDDLWVDPSCFRLAGESIDTLSPELHLMNGAYHLVLGDTEPRYGNVRDVTLMLGQELDVDVVVATAERWRGEAVLAEAVGLVGELGGSTGPLRDWAARVEVSRRDRSCLDTYRRRRSRFRRQALSVMRELPWRDRLAYARAVGLPARANLEARGRRGGRR
jgi:hypothetical protein